MSTYNSTSPYFATLITDNYLNIMVDRPIPKYSDDQLFEINTTYDLRPDLLAWDLYENSDLWWVFAQRNPNTLKDPLFDFRIGTSVYLPRLTTLKEVLGF
jgi:hypothetical protein